jgi:hypothetical protein
MKRKITFSLLPPLILGAFVCAHAQTSSISAAEFEKVTSAAYAKTATRPRRETTNAKKFLEGRVVEEELTTQDFSPPDKERWLILARTPEKNTRIEVVYIGNTEYRREDKNPWTKVGDSDPKNEIKTLLTSSGKPRGTATYSKEDLTKDGMRLQVFREKYGTPYSALGSRTRTFMLDAYGYILYVDESISEGTPQVVTYSSSLSVVYSTHPIIIEAPIK